MVFSFSSIRLKESGAMLMSGLQNGISRIAITVRSVFMNNLLAGVAVSAAGCIAAYSVHRQMDSFLNCIVFGMADTCAMIVDMLLAEENRPMIRRLLKTSFRASLTLVVGIAAVVFLLAPFLASLSEAACSGRPDRACSGSGIRTRADSFRSCESGTCLRNGRPGMGACTGRGWLYRPRRTQRCSSRPCRRTRCSWRQASRRKAIPPSVATWR